MKNKFLFIVVALIMVASMLLTACQPQATEEPAAPAEPAEPAATEAPAATEEPAATEAPAATEEPAPEPVAGGDLVVIDNTGFYTLDIFLTPWFSLTQALVYDSLVYLSLDYSEYIPLLAESWEVADDNLSVTFHVKPGITFHDGTPCDANAIVWNYEKYLDPEWPKEINQDWGTYIAGFEVIDDLTFRIDLVQPYAALFADLLLTYIVSPTAYEALGQEGFGSAPVGTGPFMVEEIVENSYVRYVKNPNYTWGPEYTKGEPPKLDSIEIRFVTDEAVSYAQLETGEAHYINLPAQYLETARANPDIVISEGIDTTTRYLGWNFTKPMYQDIRFRKAISYAIDREAVALAGYGGEVYVLASFLSPSVIGYGPAQEEYANSVFIYDPEQSIALLDEIGYLDTDGNGIREANGADIVLPLALAPSEDIQRIGEAIQSMLTEVGIGVELTPMESAAQAEMLVACQQELFIRQYGLNDATILAAMVTPPNRNCWDDATAQELALKVNTTMDPVARVEAVTELNNYMVDQFAWVPLYAPKAFSAVRVEVKDVYYDALGYPQFWDAYIEE